MIDSVDRVLDCVRVYKLYLLYWNVLCLLFCRDDVRIEYSIVEVQKFIKSLNCYSAKKQWGAVLCRTSCNVYIYIYIYIHTV